MKSYIEVTLKYLKSQRKRTLLTIIGVIMSLALISGLSTIFYSYRDYKIDEAKKNFGDYEVSFRSLNKDQVDIIKNHTAFLDVAIQENIGLGKISTKALHKEENDNNKYLDITAMDTNCLNNVFKPELIAGRYPKNNSEIILGKECLRFLGKNIGIGSKIKFPVGVKICKTTGEILPNNTIGSDEGDEIFAENDQLEYTIVGIIKSNSYYSSQKTFEGITFLKNSEIYTKNSKDNVFKTYMKISSKKNKRDIGNLVANNLGINTNIEDSEHCQIDYNRYLLRLYGQSANEFANSRLNIMILFIGSIVIICTIAVIYNSFNISVLERISQFGILRSVGATPTQIRKIVFREAFIISIIGIPLGIISGVFAIKIVLFLVGELFMNNFDPFNVLIYPQVIIISSILGFITVFLSALGPSIYAGKVSPLEAVKNSKNYTVRKIKKVSKGRISNLLFKVEGQLAYKNLTRNRKRFFITVFSLVISIVMFITFNSFANYTKVMETGKGPVYYDAFYSTQNPIDENQYKNILKQNGIEKIYKYIETRFSLPIPCEKFNEDYINNFEALSIEVFKDDKIKNHIISDNSKFLCFDKSILDLNKKHISSGTCDENALDDMGVILLQKNKIICGNGLTNKEVNVDFTKYKVGDTIKIPKLNKYNSKNTDIDSIKTAMDNNSFYEFKIIGILDKEELTNNMPQDGIYLITSPKTYKKIIGNLDIPNLYIKFNDDANRDKLISYFENKAENENGYYHDYMKVANENRKTLFQISVFVYGFITVISLIGAINIINSISTNLLIRRQEFATLKAVGMSQGQVKKMVLLEGTMHGLIASFFGSILGTILSYLTYKIEVPLFNVKWIFPWKAILISTLGSILITLLSSFFPLRKINEDSIIENIRMEE